MDDSPEAIVSNLWIFSDLLLQEMGVFCTRNKITLLNAGDSEHMIAIGSNASS